MAWQELLSQIDTEFEKQSFFEIFLFKKKGKSELKTKCSCKGPEKQKLGETFQRDTRVLITVA